MKHEQISQQITVEHEMLQFLKKGQSNVEAAKNMLIFLTLESFVPKHENDLFALQWTKDDDGNLFGSNLFFLKVLEVAALIGNKPVSENTVQEILELFQKSETPSAAALATHR